MTDNSQKAETIRTVDLVPTWEAAAQIYISNLLDGKDKSHGIKGILDMAQKMERLIVEVQKMQDRVTAMQEQACKAAND